MRHTTSSLRAFKRHYCDGRAFREARIVAGLTRCQAADLLAVSHRTIRNWEAGRVRVPYPAFKLMRILRGYDLPHDDWEGWSFRDGKLWSPVGRAFEPRSMDYLSWVFAMARTWLRERGYAGVIPAGLGLDRPLALPGRGGRPPAVGNPQWRRSRPAGGGGLPGHVRGHAAYEFRRPVASRACQYGTSDTRPLPRFIPSGIPFAIKAKRGSLCEPRAASLDHKEHESVLEGRSDTKSR